MIVGISGKPNKDGSCDCLFGVGPSALAFLIVCRAADFNQQHWTHLSPVCCVHEARAAACKPFANTAQRPYSLNPNSLIHLMVFDCFVINKWIYLVYLVSVKSRAVTVCFCYVYIKVKRPFSVSRSTKRILSLTRSVAVCMNPFRNVESKLFFKWTYLDGCICTQGRTNIGLHGNNVFTCNWIVRCTHLSCDESFVWGPVCAS